MARPRVYDEQRVSTAVRLPVTLHGRLQRAAVERDVSVNYLVMRAVRDLLERLPPPPESDVERRDR